MVRKTTGTSLVMITALFPGVGTISVDSLDPNEVLTQDHCINFVLSDLKRHAQKQLEADNMFHINGQHMRLKCTGDLYGASQLHGC
jgi:hypothetical protein